ncbi:glycosyltransferase [Orrella sp. NBD-18]|uniref:Glycosyltransferase n=1 Tax=Sheuella amnicola TaxID=2707330 RepID=A0A6B2R015_9BURK|nr:glycosyltransferase [Sheuella amnicola]NDY83493.1 glycosyltransferase [Sheuella amnicola]
MKVTQLSTDDFSGGASRAAYRLHVACSLTDVESTMRVLRHQTANDRVVAGRAPRSLEEKIKNRLQTKWREYSTRSFKTDNPIMHSFGQVSAGLVQELNQSQADVLNLHWIVNFLSIQDIGKLTKPLVWTLHDMWAFCGGEHVAPDEPTSRFRQGYLAGNRPAGEAGPDLNRQAWELKRAAWAQQKFQLVTPGHWMAGCVRDSVLFQETPVHVIPNPLEMQHLWRPYPKAFARASLGLDPNKKYVLSGSAGGMPHLKGEDLLKRAMEKIAYEQSQKDRKPAENPSEQIELLIFGQYQPAGVEPWPCPVHWLGPVRDDHIMALIYSAADVMAVPSRQDNLPNTAVEANACGTPVAAFNIGGLPDIVQQQKNGWLAPAFDTDQLAQGILWLLEDQERWQSLSQSSRQLALDRYSPEVIVAQYLNVYEAARQQSGKVSTSRK